VAGHAGRRRRKGSISRRRAGGCVALVCLDTAAIRSTARAEYARRLADVERMDAVARAFEERDRPAFDAWIRATFADELAEMRSMLGRIQRLQASMARAYEEGFAKGRPPAAFWRDPDAPAPSPAGGGAPPEDRDAPDDPWADPPPREAPDEPGDGFDPEGFEEWLDGQRSDGPAWLNQECIRLYRDLVRRLHPDRHGAMDAARTELWHRAQAAYRDFDVEALEDCRLACEGIEMQTSPDVRVSLLRELTSAAIRQVAELRRRIAKAKRHPAWGFIATADRTRLEARMRREIRRDLCSARFELRQTELMADEMRERAARASRRRPAPRARTRRAPADVLMTEPWF
jgi:hypothetical protein